MAELSRQVELGQEATDADYISFQRTVNANVRSGARTRQEQALRPKQGSSGTIEWHYPGGDTGGGGSRLQHCDRREEHGPTCVMSVSPTNSGMRLMRIIRTVDDD